MRCLMRLMVEPTARGDMLEFLHLVGTRANATDASRSGAWMFNFRHPNDNYKLRLRHPQHRATVLALLHRQTERAKALGGDRDPLEFFDEVNLNGKKVSEE